MFSCAGGGCGVDAVVAVRPQPFDAGEFGQPARGTAPGKDGNEVDAALELLRTFYARYPPRPRGEGTERPPPPPRTA